MAPNLLRNSRLAFGFVFVCSTLVACGRISKEQGGPGELGGATGKAGADSTGSGGSAEIGGGGSAGSPSDGEAGAGGEQSIDLPNLDATCPDVDQTPRQLLDSLEHPCSATLVRTIDNPNPYPVCSDAAMCTRLQASVEYNTGELRCYSGFMAPQAGYIPGHLEIDLILNLKTADGELDEASPATFSSDSGAVSYSTPVSNVTGAYHAEPGTDTLVIEAQFNAAWCSGTITELSGASAKQTRIWHSDPT